MVTHSNHGQSICFVMFNFLVQSESTLDLEIKATQKKDFIVFFLSTADCVWSWWEICFKCDLLCCKYCVLNTSNDKVFTCKWT